MYSNHFRNQRRVNTLVPVLLISAFAVVVGPLLSAGEKNSQLFKLSVDDPRPLAKAIEVLGAKYGWVITYEDPAYVNEGDVLDMTVRQDLGRRVLIPRGGRFDFSYVLPQSGKIDSPASMIQMLLYGHAASGNPGVFRLKQTGPIYHVFPAQLKSRAGLWEEQGSILDVPIIFLEQERNGIETLEAICAAVREATQTNVFLGTVPQNLLFRYSTREGAVNETARDILVRVLEGTKAKLSWQLFYDPGLRLYVLNVHFIGTQPSEDR
jgi:hypothetical protein